MILMKNEYEKLRFYYQKDIDKIAEYHIWEKLTVRKLNLTRKTIQSVYKTKKENGFKGDIIDYLCSVCLYEFCTWAFIAYMYTKSIRKTVTFLEVYIKVHSDVEKLLCRLILKDRTYLDDGLQFVTAMFNKTVSDKIKEMLYKRVNEMMTYKPTETNDSKKLTPG